MEGNWEDQNEKQEGYGGVSAGWFLEGVPHPELHWYIMQSEHHNFRFKTGNLDLQDTKRCFIGMFSGVKE